MVRFLKGWWPERVQAGQSDTVVVGSISGIWPTSNLIFEMLVPF